MIININNNCNKENKISYILNFYDKKIYNY